jgi:hypothetical protein
MTSGVSFFYTIDPLAEIRGILLDGTQQGASSQCGIFGNYG